MSKQYYVESKTGSGPAGKIIVAAPGTKVAYIVPHGEGNGPAYGDVRNEVWVKSLEDGRDAPVIADGFSRWSHLWSPDGMRIAFFNVIRAAFGSSFFEDCTVS